MDETNHVEAIDDVEAALASMMDVEPSPELAARVRQRIASDGHSRDWMTRRFVLPALGATALVVLGVLLIFAGSRRLAPERQMPAVARDLEVAPAISTPPVEDAQASAPRQEEALSALVPRNEIVVIQRLLADAQAGRFQFELVPEAIPVATELSAPGPISVPPIELMPIGVSSSFE